MIGDPRFNFGHGHSADEPAISVDLRCGVPLEDIDGTGGANDCPPTSRRGAGFGPVGSAASGYPSGTNAYFWRLLNYVYDATSSPFGDNRLYAGTLNFVRTTSGGTPGFNVVVSNDGSDWTAVTDDGAGDPTSPGMRAIASSPIGLFVGSANPAKVNDPNSGGTNVWVAIPGGDKIAPVSAVASPPSPTEGATMSVHNAAFSWSGSDMPSPGSLPLTFAYRLDPVEPSFSAFGTATSASYSMLPNGTYTFYVIAKDAAGNTESPGAAPGADNRRTFTVNAPDLPPAVTIQVAPASPNPTGNVAFAWVGSDDVTPSGSLAYDFWLTPVQADPNTFAASTSTTYSGLADGDYVFHVKARDGANNVGAEATASFTVALAAAPPAVPSPASAALQGTGVIRVTWTNVASETSYVIDRCQPNPFSGSCTLYTNVTTVTADTTFIDDAPGAPSRYAYRVQACNGIGCSAYALTNMVNLP